MFDDWQNGGMSVYNTQKGLELSMGKFHSGTTFDAEMYFSDKNDILELEEAIRSGYQPVFWVTL